MPRNYEQRERKLKRRKDAMKVNSRGLLTVILPVIAKKGQSDGEVPQVPRPSGRRVRPV
jgi:hypothetical protein